MTLQEKQHLYFIDAARIILCIIIIIVHASGPYSDGGWWWWMESQNLATLNPNFYYIGFTSVSAFFMISGYFLPKSIEKNGAKTYIKGRLLRLGIPILVGFFVIFPILLYCYYQNFRNYETINFFQYYVQIYLGFGNMPANWTGPSWPDAQFGHLWFIQHLLVYELIYIFITYIFNKFQFKKKNHNIFYSKIAVFILLLFCLVGTFIIRIWYPLITWGAILGCMQTNLSYFPIFLTSYILGIAASKNNRIRKFSSIGNTLLILGLGLFFLYTLGGDNYYNLMLDGGFYAKSFIRCIFDMVICIGLGVGFITFMRDKFDKPNKVIKSLSANTFTVYIIHFPIVIIMQYLMEHVNVSVGPKYILVAIFSVIVTFILSYIVRKIPVLRVAFGS